MTCGNGPGVVRSAGLMLLVLTRISTSQLSGKFANLLCKSPKTGTACLISLCSDDAKATNACMSGCPNA
eukprot:CAMPEP_0169282226 /NCGR_PEP_ID=MMETSP1016-20121227/56766_1 /TAXON_ID=342587 /ORGANISM="Karlodinium micrum, Strain CCMP2283" /LENGTH=68 /DNA_ID=CAMNT_0009371081 /DNA_START=168 /DNA_END=370 /DNA_ORIENTATION=-